MNRCNFNKVLNIYKSNQKGFITNNNASSSENIALDTNESSILLYAQNRKNNSIIRKGTSETIAKRTTGFHAWNDNPLSFANIAIAKER